MARNGTLVVGDRVVVNDNMDCSKGAPGKGAKGTVIYVTGGGNLCDVEFDNGELGMARFGYQAWQLDRDVNYNGERPFNVSICINPPAMWYNVKVPAMTAVEAYDKAETLSAELVAMLVGRDRSDPADKGFVFERVQNGRATIVTATSINGMHDQVDCNSIVAAREAAKAKVDTRTPEEAAAYDEDNRRGLLAKGFVAELMETWTSNGVEWRGRLENLRWMRDDDTNTNVGMSADMAVELAVLEDCEKAQANIRGKSAKYFDGYADDVVLPANTVDLTEGNDACPSFGVEGVPVGFYVDHVDNNCRESPDGKRFMVFEIGADGDGRQNVLETDDWAEARAKVNQYVSGEEAPE